MKSQSFIAENLNIAKDFLRVLGIKNPNKQQLDLMIHVISKTSIHFSLSFQQQLTAREKFCLLLAAYGKSLEETAHVLNVEKSTARTHRKNLLKKLDCKTMAEAVYEGIRLGHISPNNKFFSLNECNNIPSKEECLLK